MTILKEKHRAVTISKWAIITKSIVASITFFLMIWSTNIYAITIGPDQGLEFSQFDFTFSGAPQPNSSYEKRDGVEIARFVFVFLTAPVRSYGPMGQAG